MEYQFDKLICDLIHDSTVNYAMQQNHIPIIKRFRITNRGSVDLNNLRVNISTEPEFAHLWTTTITTLASEQSIDLSIEGLTLSPNFLGGLSERISGNIVIGIEHEEQVLATIHSPIDILAYDEWSGFRSIPEIIAAFITPNHPEVENILHQAGDILKNWTGSPSFDGYQSRDTNRVRLQAAAIYSAILAKKIGYCVPPASFEEQGQKIRTPDRIIDNKLGTCLDLTVLCSACLEQAGLFPLVIFTEGHAFPGFWLTQESFSECIQDDITLLTKRIAYGIQEICVFESTALTDGKSCSFDTAVAMGEQNLHDPNKFHFFLDVHRARIGKIRPIPIRSSGVVINELSEDNKEQSDMLSEAPKMLAEPIEVNNDTASDQTKSRLEMWERKLLDLSLRNPLLNFRLNSSSCIPVLAPNLSELEDALANGEDFQIHPKPQDWESSPRDITIYRQKTGNDPEVQLLREEFSQHRLRANLNEKDITTKLTHLFRTARTSLEESGTNTLYLSFGMMVWYESENSQKPRYSPLLLIPMEIVRRSVKTGFIVRKREDEPQFNVTLLEMLKQDFGIEVSGLNPLPEDAHGIDVDKVFTIIRRAVIHKSRWDVTDTICLGLFSFSRYIMWHDLKERTEDLKRNKLVSSLIAGSLQWDDEKDMSSVEKLDESFHPKDTFCPISADSSQLEAIHAAGKGKSLVLHGPPGTGKSQTITNIIAHCLALGKTVLFVAEKMAALTVVQQRLDKIGLAPFCLEVHSNKSKKLDVLNQIRNTIETGHVVNPENWEAEAEKLSIIRTELNKYVGALHIPRYIGHSVFQGIAKLSSVKKAPNTIKFNLTEVEAVTSEQLSQWIDFVHQLHIAGEACGHPYHNVWAKSRCADYSVQLREDVTLALTELRGNILQLRDLVSSITSLFELENINYNYNGLSLIVELVKLLLNMPNIPTTMIRVGDWTETKEAVDDWIRHGRIRDSLKENLYQRFNEKALQLDLDSLLNTLKETQNQWFIPRFLGMHKVTKTLKSAMKPKAVLAKEQLEEDIKGLQQLRYEENVLAQAGDRARELLGRIWHEGSTDWNEVENSSGWVKSIREIAGKFAGRDLARAEFLREHWSRLINEYRDQLHPESNLGKQLIDFHSKAQRVFVSWNRFNQILLFDEKSWDQDYLESNWLEHTLERISVWEQNLDGLRNWCTWGKVRKQVMEAGLSCLVLSYENGELTNIEVEPAFLRGFYSAWVENEITKDPILNSFSRHLFEDKIRQFRELDDKFSRITKQEIFARLASRIPQTRGSSNSNSEMGILMNQLQRQRGHLALRKLFQSIPNVLTRLKPCFLMSPMSVAQYLDPAHPPFDLVIFDEASQVPTWEAVGAIARGKEAIIVGDPKQLPPTSFFNTNCFDEESDDIVLQDLESILDDCLALRVPEKHLRWHYRSRHESLIAFSNYQYYSNKLLTFPSPDDLKSAVKCIPVSGFYDRGKSKQNRAEADAVIAELISRLREQKSSKSIGIVTFSQPQQRLIEDLLDETLQENPDLESYFTSEVNEPVFIKNLENVQGDERDVIIFSVGYGPDPQGRVSMNFGPLNQDGGWRRLNVAVTRARLELLVFSTLRAEQIDLSRTNAKGVADLKAFLEYAQRGKKALYEQQTISSEADFDSIFEEEVCEALRERGHKVHIQVGCSGYRIDLAIVDPEHPGRYLLGIECDGATYHRAKTARDRDKLREMILKGLGWNLHRIWSTDWWENPAREITRIEEAINYARTLSKDELFVSESQSQIASAKNLDTIVATPVISQPLPLLIEPNEYTPCILEQVSLPSEVFYYDGAREVIQTQIENIISKEGPVSFALLCRRISTAWGMQRAGNRIQDTVRSICSRMKLKKTKYGSYAFYWPHDADPEEYDSFRIPGEDEITKRLPEDLPPEEIASAVMTVIREQISLPEEDLIRETARIFGYQRIGQNVEGSMKRGIELVVKFGKVKKENDGRIVLV